jgi:hypothetical protein
MLSRAEVTFTGGLPQWGYTVTDGSHPRYRVFRATDAPSPGEPVWVVVDAARREARTATEAEIAADGVP